MSQDSPQPACRTSDGGAPVPDPELIRRGRVWRFADDHISTDLIMPQVTFNVPLEDQPSYVFRAIRPGWAQTVRNGDLIVAGTNFGTGSGRPAAQLLRRLGIRGIIAESANGLFVRNCVNYGLPIVECPGVLGVANEGDILTVDFQAGSVLNETRRGELDCEPLPSFLLDIIRDGGVLERLRQERYID